MAEMAEADRHQEEELEEERKRADSMTAARDNGINKFYKEYRSGESLPTSLILQSFFQSVVWNFPTKISLEPKTAR